MVNTVLAVLIIFTTCLCDAFISPLRNNVVIEVWKIQEISNEKHGFNHIPKQRSWRLPIVAIGTNTRFVRNNARPTSFLSTEKSSNTEDFNPESSNIATVSNERKKKRRRSDHDIQNNNNNVVDHQFNVTRIPNTSTYAKKGPSIRTKKRRSNIGSISETNDQEEFETDTILSSSFLNAEFSIAVFVTKSNSSHDVMENEMQKETRRLILYDEIRQMRGRDIKDELEERNISTRGVVEKEELVKWLVNAYLLESSDAKIEGTVTATTDNKDDHKTEGSCFGKSKNEGQSSKGASELSINTNSDDRQKVTRKSFDNVKDGEQNSHKNNIKKDHDNGAETQVLVKEIRQLRGREIKKLLEERDIPTTGIFEKEELVTRLVAACIEDNGKFFRGDIQPPLSATISTPLVFLATGDSNGPSVKAQNVSNDVFIRPSSTGKLPAIRVTLPPNNSNNYNSRTLTMLVDTACSGVVLRPSSASKANLRVVNAPVSMTAAGGSTSGTKLTQFDSFTVEGVSFGTCPVAVQDIGALPDGLDGIIGLSFLNQFATVEFDWRSQRLNLYKYDRNPPLPTTPATSSPISIVSKGLMRRTRLGVWTADVHLDTYNGPVSMLVDTGAMSTLLNWKGIAEMNLSRDDGTVNRNRSPMGAIGADNIALALTHRITLRDQFTVGGSNVIGNIGVDLRKGGPINIDIGTIPVLDILSSDGVGGILGSDFITRCSVIRLNFDESNPKIIMYN